MAGGGIRGPAGRLVLARRLGMARRMDDDDLLFNAAGSVSDTLKEVHEIEWPACAASIWDGEEPVVVIKKAVWWRCTRARHALAPAGELTAKIAKIAVTVHRAG
jgi:hypothetical protein